MAITDLTNTTWYIPSGWTAESGYGSFVVTGDFYTEEYDTSTGLSKLLIGYYNDFVDLVPYANCVQVAGYALLNNSYGFTLSFTGGDDVDDPSLIQWLTDNNAVQLKVADLSNTTWTVASGWQAEAGDGQFDVDYALLSEGSAVFSGSIAVGYSGNFDGITPTADSVWFDPLGIILTSNDVISLYITGGTDTTNLKLIAWLSKYGELQGGEDSGEEEPEQPEEPETPSVSPNYNLTFSSIKAKIQGLIDKINAKTSKTDTDLTTAVDSLIDGYGSGGGDTTINGIIEQYKVNAGATVNAGDFVEFVTRYGNGTFNSGSVSGVSACKLDNSRVLVAYTASSKGMAAVLSINGEIATVGTPIVFNEGTASWASAVTLSESKVVVAYGDSGNSKYGTAIVLTIDGTTITAGTKKVFKSTAMQYYISAVALSESKVLVAYGYGSSSTSDGAIVLSINETTITAGAEKRFNNAKTSQISAVALSENKVLVAYSDESNSSYGTAIVLNISGTTITAGTEKVFNSTSSASQISAVALSENKVLVAYCRSGYQKGAAIVLNIDGTTITAGTETVIENQIINYTRTVALSDSKVLLTYQAYDTTYGTAIVLTIDGTTITAGTKTAFDYNTVTYSSLVAFSENSALVAYNNGLGAFSGITIDGTTITADGSTLGTYVQPATSRMHNVGVAKTGGAEGETVDVYCVG